MQILQGRQACTDLPLSHAAKVKMGINHIPRSTTEILHVKDKSLSSPTQDTPIGHHVMYREPTDGRWYPPTVIQQLPKKRSYIIQTHDNVMYRKMQVYLKPYKPKKNVQHSELSKVDNNQTVTIDQKPNQVLLKHQIDLICDSYMVHTYEVGCPTIAANVIHFPASTAEKKHFFI